ncbi:MAG: hypothetical protein SFY92_07990 [Verrucomicrobiae bacterium]|nr:hypothetical protein [Verrucomicrobiae bacterium]
MPTDPAFSRKKKPSSLDEGRSLFDLIKKGANVQLIRAEGKRFDIDSNGAWKDPEFGEIQLWVVGADLNSISITTLAKKNKVIAVQK